MTVGEFVLTVPGKHAHPCLHAGSLGALVALDQHSSLQPGYLSHPCLNKWKIKYILHTADPYRKNGAIVFVGVKAQLFEI